VLQEVDCGRVVVHKFDELQLLIVSLVSDNLSAENASIPSGQLAYVITTSGTTGLPKIVRVPHDCIVRNITHLRYSLCTGTISCLSALSDNVCKNLHVILNEPVNDLVNLFA